MHAESQPEHGVEACVALQRTEQHERQSDYELERIAALALLARTAQAQAPCVVLDHGFRRAHTAEVARLLVLGSRGQGAIFGHYGRLGQRRNRPERDGRVAVARAVAAHHERNLPHMAGGFVSIPLGVEYRAWARRGLDSTGCRGVSRCRWIALRQSLRPQYTLKKPSSSACTHHTPGEGPEAAPDPPSHGLSGSMEGLMRLQEACTTRRITALNC